jgi:phosphohistidine swiveling domain-containing protein
LPGDGRPARVRFGTKAQTLRSLRGVLASAVVLPLEVFTVGDWRRDPAAIARRLLGRPWADRRLIVRSSCLSEDGSGASMAGRFLSLPCDPLEDEVIGAVERVIASYGSGDPENEVLVQPLLTEVRSAGVAFSRDPSTCAPYVTVNFEDGAGTDGVTSGRRAELRTHVHWKHAPVPPPPHVAPVVGLVLELEDLLGHDGIDVEYAVDAGGTLHLLQVRPLAGMPAPVPAERHRDVVRSIADKVAAGMRRSPFIHGDRTVYGVMPDWNPAEIIGIRPRPLSLSLYRDLVTDSVWAYQRNNYGYKNLRSHPLLVHFHGLPYIDVRVSFNSFIPENITGALAEKIVDYYLRKLLSFPQLHDKVEFKIVFSCYTPSMPGSLSGLREHGFGDDEIRLFMDSLRALTNNIINHRRGLWRTDLEKLQELVRRRDELFRCGAGRIERIYWLLEDCKRYGSLPFAGLARAGFIAVQLLQSLGEIGVIGEESIHAFMGSLNTVGSQITEDRRSMPPSDFLAKYGHLRPGTYDILSPRYDEMPDLYFDWDRRAPAMRRDAPEFRLSLGEMREMSRMLESHALDDDVISFFEFLKAGIEGREYAKFVFTKNLSDALSLFAQLGAELGFTREEMSFCDIGVVRELYLSSSDPRAAIAASIDLGRARYEVTRQLVLPPLIRSPTDVWSFEIPSAEPNYVTLKSVTAPVDTSLEKARLADSIVMIPSADPGYDWLFSFPIAGLITAYGGANSHMAVRAAELGLPAVIGAGELNYRRWSESSVLAVDCANRQVTVLR